MLDRRQAVAPPLPAAAIVHCRCLSVWLGLQARPDGPLYTAQIIKTIITQLNDLAHHKFSSNVVQVHFKLPEHSRKAHGAVAYTPASM
jgi:hypothetical protein